MDGHLVRELTGVLDYLLNPRQYLLIVYDDVVVALAHCLSLSSWEGGWVVGGGYHAWASRIFVILLSLFSKSFTAQMASL